MDQKELKDLMRAFDKSGLSKLRLKDGEFEILFQKGGVEKQQAVLTPVTTVQSTTTPQVQDAIISETSEKQTTTQEGDYIKSPMVGTFYQAPSPGAAPFVKEGDMVKQGSTVAIIEAMKIMNEIEAEFDCKILEVLVSDGEPVEFDQPLFRVEKL
jgi:acetyl-CoA carboxylase biotin carboxyl carrier protein